MLVTSPWRGVTYYSVAWFDSEEMICLEYANLRLRKFNRKENRNALAWTASAILLKRCELAYSELEYMIFYTGIKKCNASRGDKSIFCGTTFWLYCSYDE